MCALDTDVVSHRAGNQENLCLGLKALKRLNQFAILFEL